jgi:hypothetical protein
MSRTACPKLASLKAEYLGCGCDMLRMFWHTNCLVRNQVFSELRSWKWGQCLLLGGEPFLVPSIANGDVDWGRLIRNWSAQAVHDVVCHI